MMMRGLLVAVALLTLSACGESKLAAIDDFDLAKRYGECLDRKPTAPGKAQACENLRKECERRKKELGYFVCRVR